MITCDGINANLCRYRYSGTLLSSCSVSERIVGLRDANRRIGRVNRKNKRASGGDRGSESFMVVRI